MKNLTTTQSIVTGVVAVGSAYYCYKSKKPVVMFALIVVLASAAGYVVGGYAETIMPSKK
jgi:uncharacterized membrane protein YfcA